MKAIINVKNLYFNTTNYKQTLQHELSHAYEMMKRIILCMVIWARPL